MIDIWEIICGSKRDCPPWTKTCKFVITRRQADTSCKASSQSVLIQNYFLTICMLRFSWHSRQMPQIESAISSFSCYFLILSPFPLSRHVLILSPFHHSLPISSRSTQLNSTIFTCWSVLMFPDVSITICQHPGRCRPVPGSEFARMAAKQGGAQLNVWK